MNKDFQNWCDKELHVSRTDYYLAKANKDLIEMGLLKKVESITQIVYLPRLAKLSNAYFASYKYKLKTNEFIYSYSLSIALYMQYIMVQQNIFNSFENWLKYIKIKNVKDSILLNQYRKERTRFYSKISNSMTKKEYTKFATLFLNS